LSRGSLEIKQYLPEYESAVIELWQKCELTRPWNNPKLDIERMIKVYPELFLVGFLDEIIITTVMGGYDGHRGWIYSLGVLPDYRHRGFGRMMMSAIEQRLVDIGCPKINIQVRADNTQALGFYDRIGYTTEDRVSIAKRLTID